MVGKWKDKRVVQYISTEHENEMATAINFRKVESQKPLPIVKYNAFMKGVDRSDQMQSYYPLERKTLRWYKKMIIHTFQMLIVNSLYLYNETFLFDRPKKMPILEFTKSLVDSLLPDQPPTPQRPLRGPAEHSISKIVKKRANSNKVSSKRCRQCSSEGKQKYTSFECISCPEQPGLCPVQCFDRYHRAM